MQLARFFEKLYVFEFDCVETTQCLAISIDFEHLQNNAPGFQSIKLCVCSALWLRV